MDEINSEDIALKAEAKQETTSGSSITAGSLTLSSNADDSNPDEAAIDVSPYLSGATGIDGSPLINSQGLDIGENITVELPSDFSGFGFEYENYDAQGEPLTVSIDSQNVITLPAVQFEKGFIGIVATDGSFSDVVFQSNGNGGIGTFNVIDNVEWGNATPVPFELSPTLGLLTVGGIFGVNYLRKRRAAIKRLS